MADTFEGALRDDGEIEMLRRWTCEAEAREIDPALSSVNAHFDKQRAKFVAPRTASHDLEDIISLYVKVNPSDDFDPAKCTIHDVLDKARQAETQYYARGGGARSKRPRALDLAQNLAPFLQMISQMIPDEYGGGVVQGAVGLVLSAITKRSENRDRIFEFLNRLPRLFRYAHQASQKIFPADVELRQAFDVLFQALIGALAAFLGILLPKHKRLHIVFLEKRDLWKNRSPLIDSFLRVESTSETIDEALSAVEEARSAFDDAHTTASSKRLAANSMTTADTNRQARATRQVANLTHQETRTNGQNLQEFREEFRAWKKDVENMVLAEAAAAAQTGFHRIYQDVRILNIQMTQMQHDEGISSHHKGLARWGSSSHSPAGRAMPPAPPVITPDELSTLLQVPWAASRHDLTRTLWKSHSFKPAQLGHANWLLTRDRFKNWLSSPRSEVLLVDGHCGQWRDGHASPLSVFCATLARAIQSESDGGERIVLNFFCGAHISSSAADPTPAGPQGMLCSLIIQLFAQLDALWPEYFPDDGPDLSFIRATAGLEEGLHRREIPALCDVLQRLVELLPAPVDLYIILDDVARFETEMWGWKPNLMEAIRRLCALTTKFAPGDHQETNAPAAASVKVLFTAAERSTDVYRWLQPQDRISLQVGGLGPVQITDSFFALMPLGQAAATATDQPLMLEPQRVLDERMTRIALPDEERQLDHFGYGQGSQVQDEAGSRRLEYNK